MIYRFFFFFSFHFGNGTCQHHKWLQSLWAGRLDRDGGEGPEEITGLPAWQWSCPVPPCPCTAPSHRCPGPAYTRVVWHGLDWRTLSTSWSQSTSRPKSNGLWATGLYKVIFLSLQPLLAVWAQLCYWLLSVLSPELKLNRPGAEIIIGKPCN